VRYARLARRKHDHFIADRESLTAGARLLERFDTAEELLARFPLMGREGRQAGTRELVLSGTPYVFIYRVEQRGVTIVDIRDSRRGK
jgi:toxin ParE1/3/4